MQGRELILRWLGFLRPKDEGPAQATFFKSLRRAIWMGLAKKMHLESHWTPAFAGATVSGISA
jgi:hypothetical protein